MTFHNGNALTADDVVFTVEHARKSIRPDLVANIAEVKAIDDLTVEIKTPQPYAVLAMDLAELLILDRDYTTATGDEQMDLKPVGNRSLQARRMDQGREAGPGSLRRLLGRQGRHPDRHLPSGDQSGHAHRRAADRLKSM